MRIKLQLENIVDITSKRKTCFLINEDQCQTVQDLCYLLCNQFYTGTRASDVLLYLDGYFIPPQESIRIIKEEDVLTVK